MIDLKAIPFYLDDMQIEWVKNTLAGMTIEEKIGQLFVPIGFSNDRSYLQHELLDRYIGGIMYRSGPAAEMQQTHAWLQQHSRIPLLIAANLEAGGDGIAADGTPYGKQLQAAATGKAESAYRLGKVSCAEGAAVGCNWAFAPVVDIDRNWRNPITNVRTYGADPDFVLECGRAYMKAAKEENVLVSIKHFPGDGCDEVDQHLLTSVNDLSCGEWDATYGKIYAGLIEDGAPTVMVGHIAHPAYEKHFDENAPDKLVPATLSPALLQGLLRGKLGFNGLIVTDATPMVGFTSAMAREKAVPFAIEAGCDMFLFNKDLAEDYDYMMAGYQNGICISVKPGEFIAVVGPTGVGKTTFVNLIPRFYDPVEGRIFIDGKELRTWDLGSLRQHIGVVLQNNILFSGTVRDNLRWGAPTATDEELLEAARDAQAHEFILHLPDGLDTVIEQGGTNVSGGQRQRLCIARALLKKPCILILDDSTSALDSITEHRIFDTFYQKYRNTTVLLVAQRISSVQNADRIIVLDGHRICAVGTHAELLQNCGIYQAIYDSQQEGSEADGGRRQ